MAEIGSAFVSIAPSAKGFGSSLNSQVSGQTASAGKSIGRTFGKMFVLGASVLAAAGIGNLLKDSVEEAREANKIGATTEQVIKATGGAANLTANQIGALSTALSTKIGVDDEAIQAGANLLLTFKNVRDEVGKGADIFTRATAAGADLAATGFGSIESNAKMLGKALNDPTKGMTALTRAGVTFSQAQQDQIKGMVESGDLLGAQKLLLGEVESQVGGVAAATATSSDKAKVAWGNVKEDIGQRLIPVVDSLADTFVKLAPKIVPAIDSIGRAFGQVRDFLAPFIAQVVGFFRGPGGSAISDFATSVRSTFTSDVLPVLQQVGDFIAANFMPTVTRIGEAFRANVLPVLKTAAGTFQNVILPAVTSFVSYVASALFPVFKQVAEIIVGKVIPIISSLAQFFYGTLYPAIVDIVSAVAKNLKPVFDQLVATFKDSVLPTVEKLLDNFRDAQPTIEKVVGVVVKVVGAVLKFVAAVLGKVLPVLIRFVGFILRNVVPAVGNFIEKVIDVIGWLIDAGKKVIDFAGKVKDRFDKVAGWVESAVKAAKEAISKWMNRALAPIRTLIDTVQKAINKFNELRNAASNGGVRGPNLGTSAPAVGGGKEPDARLQGRDFGRLFGDGVARGITSSATKVSEATQRLIDNLKSKLDRLKSDFASLKESVAGAFTGNLFEAETAGDFIKNLMGTQGQLTALKAAFTKLVGWGLKPEFLSQLFQSGNGGLILDLAAGTKEQATQANDLFGSVTSLSNSLGSAVADEKLGDRIKDVKDEIRDLRGDVKRLARDIGREVGGAVNGAARGGRRLARA